MIRLQKKRGDNNLYTLAFPRNQYMEKDVAEELAGMLNKAIVDYQGGNYWKVGKPTRSGLYLIEFEGRFGIVLYDDSIVGKEKGIIKRHFLLK